MKDLSAIRAGSLSALLVLVSLAVGHWLYLVLVVPALANLPAVPLVWWLGLAAPTAVAIFMGGWRARTVGATLASASISLSVLVSYQAVVTALRVRPFLKADVADAFLSVGTLLGAVAVLGLAWAGHIARIQTRAQAEVGLRMCAESLDDASDGRIALERLDKPEGWYSLKDLEEGRGRRNEDSR